MPGTLIAVAKVKDILYDAFDDKDVMHIGCNFPQTDTHVAACGHRDEEPFDPRHIDETPEEYVCLECIVVTQHNEPDRCWKTGMTCVCDPVPDIQTQKVDL